MSIKSSWDSIGTMNSAKTGEEKTGKKSANARTEEKKAGEVKKDIPKATASENTKEFKSNEKKKGNFLDFVNSKGFLQGKTEESGLSLSELVGRKKKEKTLRKESAEKKLDSNSSLFSFLPAPKSKKKKKKTK